MPEAVDTWDPEAMRAFARTLNASAADVRAGQAPARAALEAAVFEGPAAGRLRDMAADADAQTERAAGMLEEIAARLMHDASTVADLIADQQRRETPPTSPPGEESTAKPKKGKGE